MLVMDMQTDAVLRVLKSGLEDSESIDVSCSSYHILFPFAPEVCWLVRSITTRSLHASVSYLSSSNTHQLAPSLPF